MGKAKPKHDRKISGFDRANPESGVGGWGIPLKSNRVTPQRGDWKGINLREIAGENSEPNVRGNSAGLRPGAMQTWHSLVVQIHMGGGNLVLEEGIRPD